MVPPPQICGRGVLISLKCAWLCLQGGEKGLHRAVIDRLMVPPLRCLRETNIPKYPAPIHTHIVKHTRHLNRHSEMLRLLVDFSDVPWNRFTVLHFLPFISFSFFLWSVWFVCASVYWFVQLPPLWRLVHAKGGSGLAWHQSHYLVQL